ncbi:hypothetical protein KXV55_004822 [Aspergillus fumigatus]|nr:hypothetical protein KXV55_004822 [Aspergillus fumigatus]
MVPSPIVFYIKADATVFTSIESPSPTLPLSTPLLLPLATLPPLDGGSYDKQ